MKIHTTLPFFENLCHSKWKWDCRWVLNHRFSWNQILSGAWNTRLDTKLFRVSQFLWNLLVQCFVDLKKSSCSPRYPVGDAVWVKDVEEIVSCKTFVPMAVFAFKDGISMTLEVCLATSPFKIFIKKTARPGECPVWCVGLIWFNCNIIFNVYWCDLLPS